MTINMKYFGLLTAIVVMQVMFFACTNNSVTGPNISDKSTQPGFQLNDLQMVGWDIEKLEPTSELSSLAKFGTTSKMITTSAGGTVGGQMTLGNIVTLPPGAVNENTSISVSILNLEGHEQTGAGVDFSPNMQFDKPIEIVLSWEFLDSSVDIEDMIIYYSRDDGYTWHIIEESEIDLENNTITIITNHFTRYAWGLG